MVLASILIVGAPAPAELPARIDCGGSYPGHLQGIATDGEATVYWSFTTVLVRTDLAGNVLTTVDVPNHHGDLCYLDGRLYVAVSDKFNEEGAESRVCVYDARSLELLETHSIPVVTYGAGGMTHRDGRFYVIGGLEPGLEVNTVYEFGPEFEGCVEHVLDSGYTLMGIQTAAYHQGRFYFGCYGDTPLLVADDGLKLLGHFEGECCLGVASWDKEHLLVGRNRRTDDGYVGWALLAAPDDDRGLIVVDAGQL
ncbi:MAG: hypothetical protein KBA64_16260 [Armatimonadetes bacterium]|nr:hypothetical protein [Armatimonadota bacterium]